MHTMEDEKNTLPPYTGIFNHSDPHYEYYLKATQGATVRLDHTLTPPGIHGLCTDSMSACFAIIIKSDDGQRFSLTHADTTIDPMMVIAECRWVCLHSSCTIFFVKGVHHIQAGYKTAVTYQSEVLPLIESTLKSESDFTYTLDHDSFPSTESGAVAIDRQGNIYTPGEPATILDLDTNQISWNIRIGQAAPNIELRYTINVLKAGLESLSHPYTTLDIQFDAERWTTLPEIDPALLPYLENPDSFHQDNFINIYINEYRLLQQFPCHHKPYKNITHYGEGLLLLAPIADQAIGLYAKNLNDNFAIIIIGEKSIALVLVKNPQSISINPLRTIIERCGSMHKVHVVYRYECLSPEDKSIIISKIHEALNNWVTAIHFDDSANQDIVSVNYLGKISTDPDVILQTE